MRWVPWIALAVALAGLGWVIHLWPAIQAAKLEGDVIRALGLSIPLLGAILLWFLRTDYDRRKEEERRKQRQTRMLVALRAETKMYLEESIGQFGPEALRVSRPKMHAHIDTAGRNQISMPVSVYQQENDVFDNIKGELTELPDDVIGPVIRYYQADEYVIETLKAFNAGLFETKPAANRKAAIDQYLMMGIEALERCFEVLDAINQEIEGKPYTYSQGELAVRNTLKECRKSSDAVLEKLAPLGSDDDNGWVNHD